MFNVSFVRARLTFTFLVGVRVFLRDGTRLPKPRLLSAGPRVINHQRDVVGYNYPFRASGCFMFSNIELL